MNCVVSKLPLTQVLLFRGLDAGNVETARLYGNVNKRLALGSVALHFLLCLPLVLGLYACMECAELD